MASSSELDQEEEPFEFETEHTVLRNNSDYGSLMKYIVLLENMRVKALKDIEELALSQNRADEDPEAFIEALKKQEINFPSRQVVPDFPQIDWSKYGMENVFKNEKTEMNSAETDLDAQMKVRGRTFNESKPETFNQLWSCEEQRRLEELLEIYPEEEVDAKRYKKIADALGTRTQTQVYSRVQKYFLKLAKLGLPIPGRAPKSKLVKACYGSIKNPDYPQKRINRSLYKKSTFFPELYVPVKMDEPSSSPRIKEEVVPVEGVVELLKMAKEQRLLDQVSPVWQEGVTCVGCRREGFVGARWTDHAGTDYCTDCIVQLEPVEKLTPVRTIE